MFRDMPIIIDADKDSNKIWIKSKGILLPPFSYRGDFVSANTAVINAKSAVSKCESRVAAAKNT
jgi:hypothetical protein